MLSEYFVTASIVLSIYVLVRSFRKSQYQSVFGYLYTVLLLYIVPVSCIFLGFEPEGFEWLAAYLSAVSSSALIASRFRPYRIANYVDSMMQRRVMWKMYMGDTGEYREWHAGLKKHKKYFLAMLGIFPFLFALTGFLAITLE